MNPTVFRALRDIAYEQAGIRLGEEKVHLVAARVGKRLSALQLRDERAYLEFLRRDGTGTELVQFLDVISTNFTSFFREAEHFDVLGRFAAAQADAGATRFRVWCAAASSGEEPYTLAMTLAEAFRGTRVDWRILATDISTKVLEHAVRGRYTARQVKPIPAPLLKAYFVPSGAEPRSGERLFEASAELKERLTFRRLNLAQPPFPMRGPFDAIFCRNVMIYFDDRVRGALVLEAERLLRPGGYLMVGHAESLNGLTGRSFVERPSTYRMPER